MFSIVKLSVTVRENKIDFEIWKKNSNFQTLIWVNRAVRKTNSKDEKVRPRLKLHAFRRELRRVSLIFSRNIFLPKIWFFLFCDKEKPRFEHRTDADILSSSRPVVPWRVRVEFDDCPIVQRPVELSLKEVRAVWTFRSSNFHRNSNYWRFALTFEKCFFSCR